MTQPLPNLPVPAPALNSNRADGSKVGSKEEFDGMLREQMNSVDQGSQAPSASGGAADEASAAKGTGSTTAEVASPPVQDVHAPEQLLAEELQDGLVPAVIEVDAKLLAGSTPGLPTMVVASVPNVVVDETATDLEVPEELAPRISRDAQPAPAALVVAKAAPQGARKAAGSPPVPPGMGTSLQPDAGSVSGSKVAMSGIAEAASEFADSPTPARGGASTTVVQAVASFSTTLQSASPALAKVQILDPVTVPVADPQWGAAVGARLAVSVAQGVQSASIALNPEDLGPLQLTLRVSDDDASVTFVSNHVAVRDAIEAALPRLREMLADEGINLADVDVFTGDERPAEGRDDTLDRQGSDDADEDGSASAAISQLSVPARDALVDTFA